MKAEYILSEEGLYELVELVVTEILHQMGEGVGRVCMQPKLADFTLKKILQERDVMQARGEGDTGFKVGKHTLLTPLAMDYITHHNMQLFRE